MSTQLAQLPFCFQYGTGRLYLNANYPKVFYSSIPYLYPSALPQIHAWAKHIFETSIAGSYVYPEDLEGCLRPQKSEDPARLRCPDSGLLAGEDTAPPLSPYADGSHSDPGGLEGFLCPHEFPGAQGSCSCPPVQVEGTGGQALCGAHPGRRRPPKVLPGSGWAAACC